MSAPASFDPVSTPRAAAPDLGAILCASLARIAQERADGRPAVRGAELGDDPDAVTVGVDAGAGDLLFLVGALAGRVEAQAVERTVQRALAAGRLSSARRCGVGGLAVALARVCLLAAPAQRARGGLGAAVRVPFPTRKEAVLFEEVPGRVVVALPHAARAEVEAMAREEGVPLILLGALGGERLEVQGALSVPVEELDAAWSRSNDALPTPRRAVPVR